MSVRNNIPGINVIKLTHLRCCHGDSGRYESHYFLAECTFPQPQQQRRTQLGQAKEPENARVTS